VEKSKPQSTLSYVLYYLIGRNIARSRATLSGSSVNERGKAVVRTCSFDRHERRVAYRLSELNNTGLSYDDLPTLIGMHWRAPSGSPSVGNEVPIR
jgi:hypothetical protein